MNKMIWGASKNIWSLCWASLPKIQIEQMWVGYHPCDFEVLFWVKVERMRIPGKGNMISKCNLEAQPESQA